VTLDLEVLLLAVLVYANFSFKLHTLKFNITALSILSSLHAALTLETGKAELKHQD